MGPAPMASTFWAPNAPPVCLLGVPSRASVSQPAASPDQYLVISSEMARWMGLSGGRSPDHQRRRLVSGTGPGGNEPLPGRRLLPLLHSAALCRLRLCKADTASHLPACQSLHSHSHISCLRITNINTSYHGGAKPLCYKLPWSY